MTARQAQRSNSAHAERPAYRPTPAERACAREALCAVAALQGDVFRLEDVAGGTACNTGFAC